MSPSPQYSQIYSCFDKCFLRDTATSAKTTTLFVVCNPAIMNLKISFAWIGTPLPLFTKFRPSSMQPTVFFVFQSRFVEKYLYSLNLVVSKLQHTWWNENRLALLDNFFYLALWVKTLPNVSLTVGYWRWLGWWLDVALPDLNGSFSDCM